VAAVSNASRKAIDQSDALGDKATTDLFTEIVRQRTISGSSKHTCKDNWKLQKRWPVDRVCTPLPAEILLVWLTR
jgi:DNA-binding ferritin-like protein